MSPDPITMEIVRNGLNAIAEEMNANLARSAFSPIIYEMKDCSVAIFSDSESYFFPLKPNLFWIPNINKNSIYIRYFSIND